MLLKPRPASAVRPARAAPRQQPVANLFGAGGPAPYAPAPQTPTVPLPQPFGGGGGGGGVGQVGLSTGAKRSYTTPGSYGLGGFSNRTARYGMPSPAGRYFSNPVKNPAHSDATYAANASTPKSMSATTGAPSFADQLQAAQDAANKANEQRYNYALDLNQQGRGDLLGDLNTTTSGLVNTARSGYGALAGQADQRGAGAMDFLTQNTQAQLGTINSRNDSELERERRRRDYELGSMQQSVLSRGLNNTTVSDPLRRQIVDDSALREQEIGNRQLDRTLGVQDTYTGRGLGQMGVTNQQALGAQEAGLGQEMGAMTNYGRQRQDVIDQLRRERIGLVSSRVDEQPDLGMYYGLLSQPRGGIPTTSGGGGGYVRGGSGMGWNPLDGLPRRYF